MVTGLPDTIDFRKVSPCNAADFLSAVLLFNGAYIRLYQRIIPNGPFFIRKGLASARISPKPGFSASGLHHRVNPSRQPPVCQRLPDSLPNCGPLLLT